METAQELKQRLGPEYQKPKVVVWFEDHARRNAQLTKDSGRPRFSSEIFYCERNPKDRFTEVKRLATEQDKEMWPDQFEHYEKVHAIHSAPRIRFLPGIDVGTVEEMIALDIYTLDQLLGTDVPEWQEWRELAGRILRAIDSKQEPVKVAPPVYTGSADFAMEIAL